jgi:3-oxoacyl-[acyl-carrier protein] reductase
MDLGLQGKRAVITGASRGIGRAIAAQLAAEGCDLAICARGEQVLQATAAELRSAYGVGVHAQSVDVGKGEDYKAWLRRAADHLGGVDIFVSNTSAGAGQGEQSWYASFEIDMLGAVRGVETLLPFLERSEAGSILFISTTAALEMFNAPNAYGAMKAALINYANALSQALAPKGIRVNTISPGPIYFEGGPWAMIKERIPAFYEQTLRQIPAGRFGTPEEVARAAAFLVSPAASLITGANLVADNGFTKRVQF